MKRRALLVSALGSMLASGLFATRGATQEPASGGVPTAPNATPGAATAPARPQPGVFVPYPRRDSVQDFIDELVAQDAFDKHRLERLLGHGRYLAEVERLMQPPIPFGQRNWLEYRARYLDERRIRDGLAFLKIRKAALARAHNEFGVPPEIVTAIVGIETLYGRMMGTFRTLDVLLTLAFDYLRRADYFRSELREFLLLARETRIDPLAVRGSFAGAIGMPQFMPSSIRRWAVDYDGDGRIDLARSAADAVGSVAKFLLGHGWQRGEPVLLPASFDGEATDLALEELIEELRSGITADKPWSMLAGRGIAVDGALALGAPVLLIDLPIAAPDGATRRELRVGTPSFSAILHYNRSYFYGAAVVDLAQALRARVAETAYSSGKLTACIPRDTLPHDRRGN